MEKTRQGIARVCWESPLYRSFPRSPKLQFPGAKVVGNLNGSGKPPTTDASDERRA